jgi:hypothetical protein
MNSLRVCFRINVLCLELASSHSLFVRTLCIACEQLVSCATLCVLVLRLSITHKRLFATNMAYENKADIRRSILIMYYV